MLIRRPCVWLCTVVILFYFSIYTLWGEEIEEKQYPCDSLLQNGPVSASVRGTFYRAESTDASHRIYLQQATLLIEGEEPVSFSHFLVYLDALPGIYPGNVLQIDGNLAELQRASNPGQFDTRAYYREQRIYYQLFGEEIYILSDEKNQTLTALWILQNNLANAIEKGLPRKQAGVMKAVLLGQKSEMDSNLKDLYRQNGIGHLLAISGLHITILCMGFYRFLLFCRMPRPAAIPLAMLILYLYGAMTGFGVATSRAVIMMILFLLAELIQKSYDLLSALAASVLIILIQKPFVLSSSSFLFSYTAVLGIALFYPVLQDCIWGDWEERRAKHRQKRKWQQKMPASSSLWQLYNLGIHIKETILESLLAGVAIQLTTLPVILNFYFEVPVYGILLNLFVLPFISLLILLGSISGFTGLFCPPLSRFLFGGVYVILNSYEGVCRFADKLPLHTIITGQPAIWQISIYYVILVIVLKFRIHIANQKSGKHTCSGKSSAGERSGSFEHHPHRASDTKMLIAWSAAVLILLLPKTHYGLCVTFLDVGQGDGIFLQSPAGTTFLIDGGSSSEKQVGTYRLLPFLKSQGISHLDYMIMTHADEDHISGHLELLKQAGDVGGVTIGCLLMPMPAESLRQEGSYQKMIQTASKACVPIQAIHAGEVFREGTMLLRCLHPPENYESDSANAYSTTISVEYGATSLLLCGDLEGNGEELVANTLRQSPISYDILKVAHHGSKNSTGETFLDLVNPSLAIISSGKNNRYGHPHKELLERLGNANIAVMNTAKDGCITVQSDGRKFHVFGYFDKKKDIAKYIPEAKTP